MFLDVIVVTTQYLEVLPVSDTLLPEVYICEGDSALIFGNYEFEEGTFSLILSDTSGCDSTVFQELYVYPFEEASIIVSGDSLIL